MAKAVYADLEDVIDANQDMLGDYDMVGIRSGIIKATTKKNQRFHRRPE